MTLLDKERLQGEMCGRRVEAAAIRLRAPERWPLDAYSLNPVQESWSRDTEDVFMVGLRQRDKRRPFRSVRESKDIF